MTEETVKVTLTEPGIAGSYVVAERRPDGVLVLKPEPEQASAEVAETERIAVHDEKLMDHHQRVSEAKDDLGDYERE